MSMGTIVYEDVNNEKMLDNVYHGTFSRFIIVLF